MTIRFRLPDPDNSEQLDQVDSPETLPDDQTLGKAWVSVGIFGASDEDRVKFIETVTEHETISIADADAVQSYEFLFKDIDFSLIKFPDFGHTHSASEEEVFSRICDWLKQAYFKGQKLHGLIYLHRTSDDRGNGSELRNLRIFRELCGSENFKNVVIGIPGSGHGEGEREEDVKSDIEDDEPGKMRSAREKALKELPEFWGDMIKESARIEQITPDRRECRNMLLDFATRNSMTLKIQQQLIYEGKPSCDTNAAAELRYYQRRHAIRDAEELEVATREKHYAEEIREVRQGIMTEAAERETDYKNTMISQTAELDELTMNGKRDMTDQPHYIDLQARRLKTFQNRRLSNALQHEDLKSQLLKLEQENTKHLEALEVAKLRRRAAAHRASLVQQQRLLEISNMDTRPRQSLAYLDDEKDRIDYQLQFCYHCLDQLSFFDDFSCCKECKSGSDQYITVCRFCRAAGKGCLNEFHLSKNRFVEKTTWSPGLRTCFRARGVRDVYCDHCEKAPGSLFLHCCSCKNDDFDLCIDCWRDKAATCLKPDDHGPLVVFAWAPPDERY